MLRVTSSVTGFDDWLNRQLEESAREVGEDVITYVARAVASQMITDQRRVDGASVEELMAHLYESACLPSGHARHFGGDSRP